MNEFAPDEFQRAVMRMVARPSRMIAAMETTAKNLDTLSVSDPNMQQFRSPKWQRFLDRFLSTLDVLRKESLIERVGDDVWGEPEYRLTDRGATLLREG
jgi:hypothetical protein